MMPKLDISRTWGDLEGFEMQAFARGGVWPCLMEKKVTSLA